MMGQHPYAYAYADMLVDHMKKGHSFDSFASTIGYPPSVVRRWLETKETFAQAKAMGENARLKTLEEMLLYKEINLETFKHLTQNLTNDIDNAIDSFDENVLIQARERFAK